MDRVGVALDEGVATKGDLASIAGVLNWISFVFIPGRPRRQVIYDAARLGSSVSYKPPLTKPMGVVFASMPFVLASLKLA